MCKDKCVYFELEDGTIVRCSIYKIILFESKKYALFTIEDREEGGIALFRFEEKGDECDLSIIYDKDEFERVYKYIEKTRPKETRLYDILNTENYKHGSYETHDLDEGMAVINESMWGWWKPRFLLNHNTKRAYEFMDKDQKLMTVTEDDIDWESLKNLPEDAIGRARALSFHFPSFIRHFENGVAEVSWQLNPDGRYYMDEDGFGMTSDEEITVYGFIDSEMNVLVKFQYIDEDWKRLDKMRREAVETLKKNSK